jgi:hypothetical protein
MTTDNAPPSEPALLARLRAHFGTDPAGLALIEQTFAAYERPNLQLAIEEALADADGPRELIGVVQPQEHEAVSLAKLSRVKSAGHFDEGPVEYADAPLADERKLACVKRGLYLVRRAGQPLALLIAAEASYFRPGLSAQVMATDREEAERFLRQLTRLTRHGKAFRGQVLSLEIDCYRQVQVNLHKLPAVRREEIILPEAVLRRIERHTLSFSRQAERLRAAGRHLKRGILLHGPPGAGKTLSAMYLAAQMPGRTVLLITGQGAGSIETAGKLARLLEPATVILEDVDLIGTQREHQTVGANAILFELLNQMDGLAEDADVLFILTTNRPDVLEPALAARPGRIDQAIEVPSPDADCRRRLLALYGRGMRLELSDPERLVARTEGVSGAFIRELLRKAAVFAAEEDGAAELVVCDRHVEEALTELLVAGGALTQRLLGAAVAGAAGTLDTAGGR